jgi:hypothetical protein
MPIEYGLMFLTMFEKKGVKIQSAIFANHERDVAPISSISAVTPAGFSLRRGNAGVAETVSEQ